MKLPKSYVWRVPAISVTSSVLLVAVISLSWGVTGMQNAVVPDRVSLFGQLMNTPIILIAPIFGVLAGAMSTVALIQSRAVSNYWPRTPMGHFLVWHFAKGFGTPFVVFLALSVFLLVFSYEIWPRFQPQLIDPTPFGFGPDGEPLLSSTDFNFAGLLGVSDWVLGLAVCAMFATAMAAYALLSQALLIATGKVFLSLVAPLVVHVLQSVGAALAGSPTAALMYVSTPFVLTATSEVVPLAALGSLVAVGCGLSAFVVARRHSLRTLQ